MCTLMLGIKICVLSVVLYLECVGSEFYSEFFSSIAHLRSLLDTQKAVIANIDDYIRKEKRQMDSLNEYMENFKREQDNAEREGPDYLANPINAFTLIKRLTKELEYIERFIKKEKIVYKRASGVAYPSELDFYSATQAISRIQSTYNLDVNDLAMGVLKGNFSQFNAPFSDKCTRMSVTDCYEVGKYWREKKIYKKAIKWFAKALYKNSSEGLKDAYPITRTDIVSDIAEAYNEIDDVENTLKWTRMLHAINPNPDLKEKIKTLKKRVEDKPKTKVKKEKSWKMNETEISQQQQDAYLNSLCRAEIEIARDVSKRLTCQYLRESHPFLKLAPIKMEQLYSDPEILMFHEVLGDAEIDQLIKIGKPKLRRPVPRHTKTATNVIKRISKAAWLNDSSSKVVEKVSLKVAQITGMDMRTALPTQIANYGIAGNYEPHVDFYIFQDKMKAESQNVGNRFATFMFYLSDVAQGGATVFLELGLSVFPVKGSALFWLNLLPSGEPDYDTIHAACPVMKGDKWILNKWIHQIGQELQFPCTLQYQKEEDLRNISIPVLREPVFYQTS